MSISNTIGSSGFPVPVGTIIAFAGQVIPPKYLLCNGGAFSGATYPILASLLAGTNTPNLVGGIIGGGTTRTQIIAQTVGPKSASFEIDVPNMPAFSTQRQSFSATGDLNGTGQTTSDGQESTLSGTTNNCCYYNGQSKTSTVGVTGTVVAQLNAQAGDPVSTFNINTTNVNPATIEIQYIIKAGY
jgi:hypothetical protein